jgi:hypothetical protein
MDQTDPPNGNLSVIQGLMAVAEGLGYQITIAAKSSQDAVKESSTQADETAIQQAKLSDLAWLQKQLMQDPDIANRLAGNYAAVFQQRVVALGDNRAFVVAVATQALGFSSERFIVVPIAVRDPEAADVWQNLQNELGIA